jgi:arginyl-tRNA synthetase
MATKSKTDKQERRFIVLRKSNGSTLYLSRDVAAALHRYELWRPQKMMFVVCAEL